MRWLGPTLSPIDAFEMADQGTLHLLHNNGCPADQVSDINTSSVFLLARDGKLILCKHRVPFAPAIFLTHKGREATVDRYLMMV